MLEAISAPVDARQSGDAMRDQLMHHAIGKPAAVLALAGVLATAFATHGTRLLPMPGLDSATTRRLMVHWFPGADIALGLDWDQLSRAHRIEPRYDEIEEIVALLLDYAAADAGTSEELCWVAHAVGQATLGDNHLWQDLQLPSRRELSQLMNEWFPRLSARNDRDMKWKKFLYKQLCERAEISICRAPSCAECDDYARCFGPEDAGA